MQGDQVRRLDGLKRGLTVLQTVKSELDARKVSLEDNIGNLTERALVLSKVAELYRHLLDRLVLTQAEGMCSVVTEGLKTVLYNQSLALIPELGQRSGKVTLQFLLQQGGENGPKGIPQDSFGGGPTALASLILRVLLLLRSKRAKFLVLDETLAPLSDEYIEHAGRFLATLAEQTGVPILLVTHKSQYLEEATGKFQATEGPGPQLVLKSLK